MNHSHHSAQSSSSTTCTAPNTLKAWQPIKRPVAAIVIAAQLALVLQPLSALAQGNGTPTYNPAAQAQLNRIHLAARDIEAGKARQAKEQASPADKASEHLAQIEELSKSLHADRQARGLAAATTGKPKPGQQSNEQDKDLRALGPNIQIEVQRSPNKALALSETQRQQKLGELNALLAQTDQHIQTSRADFASIKAELAQKQLPAEILARHDSAIAQFEQRSAQFSAIAQNIQKNQTNTATDTAEYAQAATK